MERVELEKWNRELISESVELLEDMRSQADDAIGRLRGFLALNPGGETLPRTDTTEEADGKLPDSIRPRL